MMQPATRAADPWPEIRREFGYDEAQDAAAARQLAEQLRKPLFDVHRVLQRAGDRLREATVIVVGAADSAPRQLERAPSDAALVAADGATTAVLEAGRRPDLIVTDLDGRVEDQVQAVAEGSLVFVHAHADNQLALRRWLDRFEPGRVAGTCQTPPESPLINPGGFTDGDRACYLAHFFNARRILLAGFDFSGPIGRYSGRYDGRTKPAKLRWARELLNRLSAAGARIEFA